MLGVACYCPPLCYPLAQVADGAMPPPSGKGNRRRWKWNRESRIVAGPPAPLPPPRQPRNRHTRTCNPASRRPIRAPGRRAHRAHVFSLHLFFNGSLGFPGNPNQMPSRHARAIPIQATASSYVLPSYKYYL